MGMIIQIKKEFQNDFTTRLAGERLREMIVSISQNDFITLDFKDVKIASSSFFDEGIAKLALVGWTEKRIEEKIEIKNIFKMDRLLLEQVCEERGLHLKK